MKISTKQNEEVIIVCFEGNLDTNTAPEAEARFGELIGAGATRVLVDFGRLDYISSAGLRVLLATAKKLGVGGGRLRICGLNETVHEIFEMSGFSTILQVYETEGDALQEF